jgi:pyruvate dehydrogenase (quinone)
MNGMNALITASKYWKQWKDPRFVVLVLNNHDLNQVTWELRAQSGDPKFEASQDVPDLRYSKYAELLGFKGLMVASPDDVGRVWDEALAADRPVLVEALTDPNVPPIPPHISLKNMQAFTSTLWQGDPDMFDMIRNSAKEIVEEYLPHKG